jgi:GNAT superfamily N-acetyltransferase
MEDFEKNLTIHRNEWFWGRSEYVIYSTGIGIVTVQYQNNCLGVAVISGLSVVPEYRGIGLGRKLIEYAEKSAKENGCWRVELGAQKDSWVLNWYERLGYTRYVTKQEIEDSFYEEQNVVRLHKLLS